MKTQVVPIQENRDSRAGIVWAVITYGALRRGCPVPAFLVVITRRICHAPPAMGVLQAASGKAVITPQRRVKRAPQGSPSDVGGRHESLIMPPRCRRARCAVPGLRTA